MSKFLCVGQTHCSISPSTGVEKDEPVWLQGSPAQWEAQALAGSRAGGWTAEDCCGKGEQGCWMWWDQAYSWPWHLSSCLLEPIKTIYRVFLATIVISNVIQHFTCFPRGCSSIITYLLSFNVAGSVIGPWGYTDQRIGVLKVSQALGQAGMWQTICTG